MCVLCDIYGLTDFSDHFDDSDLDDSDLDDSDLDYMTGHDGIDGPSWVRNDPQRRAALSEIATIGLDLAKDVCQVHRTDGAGRAV